MAAEFPEQFGFGVQDVRQPARVRRDAIGKLLIEPQPPHRERGGAEICKPEIGCDDGGDARHVGCDASRSVVSPNTSDILPTLAL
jgi:hypothetical protein